MRCNGFRNGHKKIGLIAYFVGKIYTDMAINSQFVAKKFAESKKITTFALLLAQNCCCSSVVEHFLGKEEVTSSSLVNSSKEQKRLQ